MKDVRINFQTVGNLKKYLDNFPDDAKVIIWNNDKAWDLEIAINFENQIETKTVQLLRGFKTEIGKK